jgi:polar amino acid transport system permease protein
VTTPVAERGRPETIRAVPVRHPGRWVAIAVLAVLGAMFGNLLSTDKYLQWGVVRQYLFSHIILHGVVLTIEYTILAMLFGVILGAIAAVMRLSPNPVVSGVAWLYIWLFRGTPLLVQILLWFNIHLLIKSVSIGVPFGPHFWSESTNKLVTPFLAGLLALSLNEGAYMSEIVRAGIISVDEGQTEAAHALGMTRLLTMRRVILPQAMRVIVPPTGNETNNMLKNTSLLSVISIAELLRSSQIIYNRTFQEIPLLIDACIWYLVMTSVLQVGQFYIERYYGRGSSRTPTLTPVQKARLLFSSFNHGGGRV